MTVVRPAGRGAGEPTGRSTAPDETISPTMLLRHPDQGWHSARQPGLGLRGFLLVVPIAGALAFGAGVEGSVRVLAPIITYSLPLVVMVAFWWGNWPGSRLRASEAGWADTLLIAAGGIVLTGIGQAAAGRVDPAGLFDPSPGPGHVPTFPATMAMGGTAFIAMLQLTLVGEGWPLRRLRPVVGGLLALACSWLVAIVVYLFLVEVEPLPGSDVVARHGSLPGSELGAVLVLIGAWQVLCYVGWRGWPFARIGSAPLRLSAAHVFVLGGGILTYVIAHRLLGLQPSGIAAGSGCFIASGLVFGMLLQGWLSGLGPPVERATLLLAILALTAVLAVGLTAAAHTMRFTVINPEDWVQHVTLNALATSIILHVAIGRRWPFLLPDQEVVPQVT